MNNLSALETNAWFDVLMKADESENKDSDTIEFIQNEMETLDFLENCLEAEM